MAGQLKKVTLRLPEELADTITKLAAANGISVNSLLTATCMVQAELFERFDCTPLDDWPSDPSYERWQVILHAARDIDRRRRARANSRTTT